ncbi:MAG: hypothetical protein AB7K86_08570 [Rhodospirillales bacterium]
MTPKERHEAIRAYLTGAGAGQYTQQAGGQVLSIPGVGQVRVTGDAANWGEDVTYRVDGEAFGRVGDGGYILPEEGLGEYQYRQYDVEGNKGGVTVQGSTFTQVRPLLYMAALAAGAGAAAGAGGGSTAAGGAAATGGGTTAAATTASTSAGSLLSGVTAADAAKAAILAYSLSQASRGGGDQPGNPATNPATALETPTAPPELSMLPAGTFAQSRDQWQQRLRNPTDLNRTGARSPVALGNVLLGT